jgi:Icc-related predicted phosphoesterase
MTKKKLQEFIDLKTDKKKVLVTHMAPSAQSLEPAYRNATTNDAYYEELFDMLVDSDIKIACHGHIHEPVDYMIGNCHVVSNPRGYYGHETQAYNYKFKQLEI